MRVNQRGAPIAEEQLFAFPGATHTVVTTDDLEDAIALLCAYLKVELWRTNATKHGNTELTLRKSIMPAGVNSEALYVIRKLSEDGKTIFLCSNGMMYWANNMTSVYTQAEADIILSRHPTAEAIRVA